MKKSIWFGILFCLVFAWIEPGWAALPTGPILVVTSGKNGSTQVEGSFARSEDGSWHESNNDNAAWTYRALSESGEKISLFDEARNVWIDLDLKNKVVMYKDRNARSFWELYKIRKVEYAPGTPQFIAAESSASDLPSAAVVDRTIHFDSGTLHLRFPAGVEYSARSKYKVIFDLIRQTRNNRAIDFVVISVAERMVGESIADWLASQTNSKTKTGNNWASAIVRGLARFRANICCDPGHIVEVTVQSNGDSADWTDQWIGDLASSIANLSFKGSATAVASSSSTASPPPSYNPPTGNNDGPDVGSVLGDILGLVNAGLTGYNQGLAITNSLSGGGGSSYSGGAGGSSSDCQQLRNLAETCRQQWQSMGGGTVRDTQAGAQYQCYQQYSAFADACH